MLSVSRGRSTLLGTKKPGNSLKSPCFHRHYPRKVFFFFKKIWFIIVGELPLTWRVISRKLSSA